MHTAPMAPVKVVRRGGLTVRPAGWRIMEGSGTDEKRAIVAYAHPRTQGSDRAAARAARSLSVFQRGGRHHLRRQGPRAARPRPQLSGAYGSEPQDRRAAGRGRPPRGHRHRLGGRGARAREQPHQAAHAEVQHPAARRQELSVPAAHDERGVSARARRAPGRARRQLLRGTVSCRRSFARKTMA